MEAKRTSFTRSPLSSLLRRLPPFIASPIRYIYSLFQLSHRSALTEPGTLNNQQKREQLVIDLLTSFSPNAIAETGTYLGAGTAFFLEHTQDISLFSCEQNKRFFHFCQKRFTGNSLINLFHGSSLDFLQQLSLDDPTAPLFFYLDAHWEGNLPLNDEIAKKEVLF